MHECHDVQSEQVAVQVGLVVLDHTFFFQAFASAPTGREAQRQAFTELRIGNTGVCLQQGEDGEIGVIKNDQANLDRKLLGLDIMAFVHVRFAIHTDHAPDAFEAVVKELPQVLSCHKITGDADYLLQVLAEDLDSYSEFVESVLRRQLGIASIQSSLALREVKATSRVAIAKRE